MLRRLALYGDGVGDLKIRTLLPFPTEQRREAWDVQVTFLLGGLQYTVDLLINERDGQITNARLIDTMVLIKILKPILTLFVYVLASNGTKKTCKSIGFKARA